MTLRIEIQRQQNSTKRSETPRYVASHCYFVLQGHIQSCIRPFHARDMERSHDGSKCDSPSALYIIVETCHVRRVSIQDPASVVEAKILKMYVCLGISFSTCLDKLVYKGVVLFALGAFLTETKIQFIVEKLLVLSCSYSLAATHRPSVHLCGVHDRHCNSHLCRSQAQLAGF